MYYGLGQLEHRRLTHTSSISLINAQLSFKVAVASHRELVRLYISLEENRDVNPLTYVQ